MRTPKRSVILTLVVVGIAALLELLWFPPKLTNHTRGKHQIAKIQILELEGALQLFRFDTSRCPTTDEGLDALIHNPGDLKGWKGPYLQHPLLPTDPWGRPYTYRCSPLNGTYDLVSYGQDGASGGQGSDEDILLLNRESCLSRSQDYSPADKLLEQFKSEQTFWRQFEIGKQIIAVRDTTVLRGLDAWLNKEDRHARGNAAFIFAALGDDRGFKVIREIIEDRSDRPLGQGYAAISRDERYLVGQQIRSDRYYAVHLLGDLKDPRAVPLLVSLLNDEEVSYIVPWSLGEIGDKRANAPLIEQLGSKNPSLRVLSIYALEKLGATEALPRLRRLLADDARSNFDGLVSVAEAAQAAIAELESKH